MTAPFADRLLAWYDVHRRELPWRGAVGPWATWVSEVMLQQTRVEVVRDAFERFVARYPEPAAWAEATDADLLLAWQGLGYYRRARLLREGARAAVARHGGHVPSEPEAIAALPGIGDYTAGAIASIAFGHVVPAIDGNVERVLARHRGITANVKSGAGRKAVRAAATQVLSRTRPGDFNQALMDFGAGVCTPRGPRCGTCPLAEDCVARARGTQAELPVLPARRAAVAVRTRVVLASTRDGRVLGRRVAAGRINAGQVDLPGPGPIVQADEPEDLQRWLDEALGPGAVTITPEAACTVRHGITHHRIEVHVHPGTLATLRLPDDWSLAGPNDGHVPWTTIARKALARWDGSSASAEAGHDEGPFRRSNPR